MHTTTESNLSLPVRFAIGVAAVTFLLLVCSAPRGAEASPAVSWPAFGRPCQVVADAADYDTGRLDRIAARHGGIDFRGPLAFPDRIGRWSLNDTGRVFGYSLQEDSVVWRTARCAALSRVIGFRR